MKRIALPFGPTNTSLYAGRSDIGARPLIRQLSSPGFAPKATVMVEPISLLCYSPIVDDNTYMPGNVRLTRLVEVGVSNFAFGLAVGKLLRPSCWNARKQVVDSAITV